LLLLTLTEVLNYFVANQSKTTKTKLFILLFLDSN